MFNPDRIQPEQEQPEVFIENEHVLRGIGGNGPGNRWEKIATSFRIGDQLYYVYHIAEPEEGGHWGFNPQKGHYEKSANEPGWLVGDNWLGDPNQRFEPSPEEIDRANGETQEYGYEGGIGALYFSGNKERRTQEYSRLKIPAAVQDAIEKAIEATGK